MNVLEPSLGVEAATDSELFKAKANIIYLKIKNNKEQMPKIGTTTIFIFPSIIRLSKTRSNF